MTMSFAIISMMFMVGCLFCLSVQLWDGVCRKIPAKEITFRNVLKLDENPKNDNAEELIALGATTIAGIFNSMLLRFSKIEKVIDLKFFMIMYAVFIVSTLAMLVGEIYMIPHYRAYKYLQKLRAMSILEVFAANFMNEQLHDSGVLEIEWAKSAYVKFKLKTYRRYDSFTEERKDSLSKALEAIKSFEKTR